MQLKNNSAIATGAAAGNARSTEAMNGGEGRLTHGMRPPQVPLFFNQAGVASIEIGVSTFDCIGARPPHDHPRIYLNMGEQTEIQCPYCSTRYRLNPALRWNETIPPGCCAAP
jgi:uncharacterized Zn-finger protein